ncbi:MAG: phosphoribosylaminoimidazolesuccinocarboxamide synthase [Candidatus Thorarchaeota archaeon]|nr:MAG: phosphoribosylaminoimidazolesuccinocarboxamide synthase [Candidatus Thorarchaeota archaeon]
MKLIHEGKVKRVYQDPDSEDRVIIDFTDTVTAGDGAKREEFPGKGKLACDISYILLGFLEGKGIDTHLVKRLDDSKMLCQKANIIPVEVVCRNIAAGSFCRRYGVNKGERLAAPLVEFFLKDDSLGDPLITARAAESLSIASGDDLQFMESVTLSANHYLSALLSQVGLDLVDFKLEFGRTSDGHMVIADEISPDTMRIWDTKAKSLDKDVFREDKGDLLQVYTEFYERIREASGENVQTRPEVVEVIVEPKGGIKNPPGEVTKKALIRLGFAEVLEVRVGKVFRIRLQGPLTSEVLKQLKIMSVKLLSNPISEKYHVRLN